MDEASRGGATLARLLTRLTSGLVKASHPQSLLRSGGPIVRRRARELSKRHSTCKHTAVSTRAVNGQVTLSCCAGLRIEGNDWHADHVDGGIHAVDGHVVEEILTREDIITRMGTRDAVSNADFACLKEGHDEGRFIHCGERDQSDARQCLFSITVIVAPATGKDAPVSRLRQRGITLMESSVVTFRIHTFFVVTGDDICGAQGQDYVENSRHQFHLFLSFIPNFRNRINLTTCSCPVLGLIFSIERWQEK